MSLSIHQFLIGKSILMLPQLAYYPNLSLCDFWLFPRFRETIKAKRLDTTKDIISNMTHHLHVILKEDFHWQEHWNKCVCMLKGSTLKQINGEIDIRSFHHPSNFLIKPFTFETGYW